MKMDRWSDYEKYIVMLTTYNSTARGVRLGYQAFLAFKKVKEALTKMTNQPGGSYSYEDTIYKQPITSLQAIKILEQIEKCQWDENIRIVANQINAGRMLSPRQKFTSVIKK